MNFSVSVKDKIRGICKRLKYDQFVVDKPGMQSYFEGDDEAKKFLLRTEKDCECIIIVDDGKRPEPTKAGSSKSPSSVSFLKTITFTCFTFDKVNVW